MEQLIWLKNIWLKGFRDPIIQLDMQKLQEPTDQENLKPVYVSWLRVNMNSY